MADVEADVMVDSPVDSLSDRTATESMASVSSLTDRTATDSMVSVSSLTDRAATDSMVSVSSLPDRTATESMVSVSLSDEFRLSVADHDSTDDLATLSDEPRLSVTNHDSVDEPRFSVTNHDSTDEPRVSTNHDSTDELAAFKSQPDDEDQEYMASLLAKLDMENDALATDPKNAAVRSASTSISTHSLADDARQSHSSLQIPPEALGISLGDFWAFVAKDYPQALASMPTLTPIMIRKGVPDFLRSVVWASLVGSRDDILFSEYQLLLTRLENEQSSIDGIIDKDVGRCFPAHELFEHPEGEGQKMLGHILKCYNLYDPEIGYCQGMGFIVGILLMKMEAQDAFCVFVRLMQNHGLRDSYSKTLSGLHSRIFQVQRLLSSLSPTLIDHFKNLGVEFAYLSQWFMTIFATTCPLDTLFRIYDVVLAEGANETIMRVALALILKSEQRLLEMTELDEVLSLLLGRGIWEPYESNADQLIEEVTTLYGHVVTRTALDKLHRSFLRESEGPAAEKTARALGFGNLHGSAFRLFDTWWAPTKPTSLSPAGFLRRTTSKQSLSTVNSIGLASGANSLVSVDSYASTAPTEEGAGRNSATPTKMHRSLRQEDRNLHEQVEGLLMALSEVQREAAQTAADLQREQEKREKAQDIVGDLVKLLHQKKTVDAYTHRRRTTMPERIIFKQTDDEKNDFRRRSNLVKSVTRSIMSGNDLTLKDDAGLQASLLKLCAVFDEEQLLVSQVDERPKPIQEHAPPNNQSEDAMRVLQLEQELATLRRRMVRDRNHRHARHTSDLKENQHSNPPSPRPIRTRRALHSTQDRNSLDAPLSPGPLSISVPRSRPRTDLSSPNTAFSSPHDANTSSPSATLTPSSSRCPSPRPPRMIRTQSGRDLPIVAPQKFSKRASSLSSRAILATPAHQPPPDETLLVELVSAKTREATAILERDEMKVQLDRQRRAHEAKEKELRSLVESTQAIMAAQMEAHSIELERLKGFYAGNGNGSRSGSVSVSGHTSLTPSPAVTPIEMPALAPQKGWGWFNKSRSVSASAGGAV